MPEKVYKPIKRLNKNLFGHMDSIFQKYRGKVPMSEEFYRSFKEMIEPFLERRWEHSSITTIKLEDYAAGIMKWAYESYAEHIKQQENKDLFND
tara:strand:+ start:427 stop:708 length:282 start_codon:yes stop_codon:yes gene_type:complete